MREVCCENPPHVIVEYTFGCPLWQCTLTFCGISFNDAGILYREDIAYTLQYGFHTCIHLELIAITPQQTGRSIVTSNDVVNVVRLGLDQSDQSDQLRNGHECKRPMQHACTHLHALGTSCLKTRCGRQHVSLMLPR